MALQSLQDIIPIQIFDQFPDGVIVTDSNQSVLYANQQAAIILDRDPDMMLNKPLDCDLDFDYLLKNKLVKEMVIHSNRVEVHISDTLWNSNEYFIICLRDVTEKSNQQDIIETVFQAFSVLQEGFFICNEKGEIIYANPSFEKITGYHRSEIYGRSPSFLKSGVHTEEFYDDFYKKLSEEGEWSGIIWNKRANGEVYPESLRISTIFKELGSIKYYVAIFTDVTDYIQSSENLKKSHKEAIESDQKKTEYLSKASHEIRAPMSGIIGYAELLADTNLTTEQREFLEVIRSSSKSLLNMINEILDISKLQSGSHAKVETVFSVRELVQELYKFFKVHTREKPIVLGHYFSGKLPDWLEGEKEPLRQILTNLLSNAFKFTKKGKISFGVDSVEDLDDIVKIHFSVTDTGIGFDRKYIKNIFDPFFQIENANQDSTVGAGSGLGLAIVKSIVEKNGGSIDVDSDPGMGTQFKFSFVLKKTNKQGKAAELLKENNTRLEKWKNRGRSISVILAEDNYPNQMYIKRILEKNNFFVTVVSTGEQVINCLKEKDYDLVLMDIRMPKMNGLQATKIIRESKESKYAKIPIVALTGMSSDEERDACKEAGMNGFLVKPIESEKLLYEILKHVFP